MSVEGFLLVNWIVDTALLAAVARVCGAFRARRAGLLGLVCAVYGMAAVLSPVLAALPVQLAMLAVIARLLVGRRDARLWGLAALLLAAGMLAAGGAAALLSPSPVSAWQAIPRAFIGIIVLCAPLCLRNPVRDVWQVQVELRVGERSARFPALIDTGNRLREPLSGQPVLIAEEALLEGLLPVCLSRSIAYGALGGSGRLPCFRPSGVWVRRSGRRVAAPPVWVAVVPGRIPGAARALAPCEFAVCRF